MLATTDSGAERAQYSTYTKAELHTRMAKFTVAVTQFKCLPKSKGLTLRACGPQMPSPSIPSLPKRLLVGTTIRSSPNKSRPVWAHVIDQNFGFDVKKNHKNTRKPDRVAYYSINKDKKYEPIDFKEFELMEPFSHINLGQARGPGKILYLVLYYFLEKVCNYAVSNLHQNWL